MKNPGLETRSDAGLVVLIEALEKINTNNITAKINETSISDNNGGRIEL